jgi:hypothetical protein
MTLDTASSLTLCVQAVLLPTLLVIGSRLDDRRRMLLLFLAITWLLLLAGLAALGLFSTRSFGMPFVGVAAIAPVLAVLLLRKRSATVRSLVSTIPITLLVAVHAGRLLGATFLALHAAGRLPPTFAYLAGWGDILVAIDSIPLAFAVFHRVRGLRPWLLVWNCLGFADLIVALTLGAGSAAGSPVRFLYEEPSSALMGTLPWFLIPGYLVPLYLFAHVAIFFRLSNAASTFACAADARTGERIVTGR